MQQSDEDTLTEVLQVLASPAVAIAGIIAAVLVHRQRLKHDRTLADLGAVRELLSRGLALVHEMEESLLDYHKAAAIRDDVTPSVQHREKMLVFVRGWYAYTMDLEVIVGPDEAVCKAAHHLHEVYMGVVHAGAQRSREALYHSITRTFQEEALPQFRAEARRLARANSVPAA
jgi:hypothetical protein